MKYHPNEIEAKWQKFWADNQTFQAENASDKKKYYVLDMFPYPSGAGLHVGHPLGYIASDIVARFKRHQGFNVLHPQGYDSFGLPAEQYAIQTGQHPEKTTKENIARYREQLDKIGFSFDWSREVRTSNPDYYKHTQWIFIQLYNSWYNMVTDQAEDISTLIATFEKEGNQNIHAACDDDIPTFSAQDWQNFSVEDQQKLLLKYRLTYLAEAEVNWCPALGTVLANDEIVNGVSERGGHPVIRKKMTQWMMRISAYAERLLQGLETIDWTESLKESQRNWIGKSKGASITFKVLPHPQPLSKEEGSQSHYNKNYHYQTANPDYAKELVDLARLNRKSSTIAEDKLWQEVRGSKLGFKIRRQHYIGNFIVDFVSLEKNLIIELDGGYHFEKEQPEKDAERTLILEQKHGFKVIRFKNEEVLENLDIVLSKIKDVLNSRKSYAVAAPLSFGEGSGVRSIQVFTTRPDTLFGVTFMTLAPEHDLVGKITTAEQKQAVEAYIEATSKRSERERMADVKTISGVFTGAYAEHPFTKEPIPVWIGDYVLAGYGTGAVMAVPAGDERDFAFANFFKGQNGMPAIKNIFKISNSPLQRRGEGGEVLQAFTEKGDFILENSDFLDGLDYKAATEKIISAVENKKAGKGKTNYRLRDAVFSRQRYWGEPIPIYYKNGVPYPIPTENLPLELPEVEKYLPTEDGQPPLGNATAWAWDSVQGKVVSNDLIDDSTVFPLELNTMPGWAGSSWYWMRYMDAHNLDEIASKEALNYWGNVDLYIGGSEHATGHLLYARFWNKFLKDRGYAPTEEPFKKLINQGMILGMSALVYRIAGTNKYISKNLKNDYTTEEIRVDVNIVNASDEIDLDKLKNWIPEFKNADFITENGKFIVGREVEKMSKRWYNVVNPDDICNEYGADTLRLYEMFLGPLEQAKPWNTAGITGVFGFLKKLWKLYHSGENESFYVSDAPPSEGSGEAFKSLHKTIKKVTEDIENFSFNTSVSQFMICVNELQQLKCHHRAILEPLAIIISPYAPHIAEELWSLLGHEGSISTVPFPKYEEKYLVESEKEYPVSFNGKMRFTLKLPLDLTKEQIQEKVMADERTKIQLAGSTPKNVIIVPGKIINIVG
jgi:leucyl-tRNA synthetase